MRCPRCKTWFPANNDIYRWPGGQDSPGTFLLASITFAAVGALLIWLGFPLPGIFLCFFAPLALVPIPLAWHECNGVRCPKCNVRVPVWPWSL